MKRRPISYAWALHAQESPSYRQLSEGADEGLAWALELAEDAGFRAERALRGEAVPALSERELAERDGVSPQLVSTRIRRARRELFSELSQSGIYYRLARGREIASRPQRHCLAPGCGRPLPRAASRARQ